MLGCVNLRVGENKGLVNKIYEEPRTIKYTREFLSLIYLKRALRYFRQRKR